MKLLKCEECGYTMPVAGDISEDDGLRCPHCQGLMKKPGAGEPTTEVDITYKPWIPGRAPTPTEIRIPA